MRFCFGQFVLDDTARQLFRGGEPVHLTPKSFELLELLIGARPRAISKSEFHERLWPGTHVTDSNLPVLIHELREVLGDDPHEPRWIRTVARFGYSFCGEAQSELEDAREDEDGHDLQLTREKMGQLVDPAERPFGACSGVEARRIGIGRCPQGDAQVVAGRLAAMVADKRVLPNQQANHHQGYQAAAHVHRSLIGPIPSTPFSGVGRIEVPSP